jgi:amino acid transporter
MYGPRFGKLLSFLFVWQLTFSAPLSIASGCIGLAQYAGYLWPALRTVLAAHDFHVAIPAVGTTVVAVTITYGTFLAMSAVALAVFLLYRRITIIGRLASFLWVGRHRIGPLDHRVRSPHFNAQQAFTFPPGAWTFDQDFFLGLGAALLIAVYDYWGYYNVCYLGAEVRDPCPDHSSGDSPVDWRRCDHLPDDEHRDPRAMPWQEVQASTFIALTSCSASGACGWRASSPC